MPYLNECTRGPDGTGCTCKTPCSKFIDTTQPREQASVLVTLDSAFAAISHVNAYNGPGRMKEAHAMLVSASLTPVAAPEAPTLHNNATPAPWAVWEGINVIHATEGQVCVCESADDAALIVSLRNASTTASASGEAVAEWVNEEQGFQYLIPGRLPDGTKLCRATAPSRNAAPLDQEAFEAQARYQGATDFEPSGVGMVCENGWFPATYRDPMTELAWRVWANKSDRAALTQQSAAQADWKARSERAEAALALSEQFRMKDGLSHAVERAAQASHAGAAEMPLYTCKGKGGEYELIGVAYGAGRSRGQLINLYRETASGVRYFRMPDDFAERMERIERAAMSAAIEQKEKP